jgi:hypothetical protein
MNARRRQRRRRRDFCRVRGGNECATSVLNRPMAEGGIKMTRLDKTVPVSERAVLVRVNRRLARDGERLKKWRPRNGWKMGWYYQVDVNRNWIRDDQIELEAFARELGVLGVDEEMEVHE